MVSYCISARITPKGQDRRTHQDRPLLKGNHVMYDGGDYSISADAYIMPMPRVILARDSTIEDDMPEVSAQVINDAESIADLLRDARTFPLLHKGIEYRSSPHGYAVLDPDNPMHPQGQLGQGSTLREAVQDAYLNTSKRP